MLWKPSKYAMYTQLTIFCLFVMSNIKTLEMHCSILTNKLKLLSFNAISDFKIFRLATFRPIPPYNLNDDNTVNTMASYRLIKVNRG